MTGSIHYQHHRPHDDGKGETLTAEEQIEALRSLAN